MSKGDAVMSACGRYRYWLERHLDPFHRQPAVFVMINPSTADATQDDPTIRRCKWFALSWGCGRLIVVNLFALRSTDPAVLWADGVADPIGPDNDEAIRRACQSCWSVDGAQGVVVCAWGTHGAYMDRGQAVRGIIESEGHAPRVLRLTKGGHPAHPLYLPKTLKPVLWESGE